MHLNKNVSLLLMYTRAATQMKTREEENNIRHGVEGCLSYVYFPRSDRFISRAPFFSLRRLFHFAYWFFSGREFKTANSLLKKTGNAKALPCNDRPRFLPRANFVYDEKRKQNKRCIQSSQ